MIWSNQNGVPTQKPQNLYGDAGAYWVGMSQERSIVRSVKCIERRRNRV